MIEIKGKEGISARVIQHSIASQSGKELITFEIDFPRFILAENNTHKMLSKNGASSRAIPIIAMHEQIRANPARPVFWGKNQAGMQAKEELTGEDLEKAKALWNKGMNQALDLAVEMSAAGMHKQIANRVTEAWMMQRMVTSGTEWANFFHLRDHPDAQPEFHELASIMHKAKQLSKPMVLKPGEWHVPYVERVRLDDGELVYIVDDRQVTLDEARMVSASCCAQVSYRKNDGTLEKARTVYERLMGTQPCHASPFEHQGTPISSKSVALHPGTWEDGVTHVRRDHTLWSANFGGWIQNRQLIPNEAVW